MINFSAHSVSFWMITIHEDKKNFSIASVGFNCTFERNLCSWTQDNTDQFDWTRTSGSTPSSSTGPSVDHTTGTGKWLFSVHLLYRWVGTFITLKAVKKATFFLHSIHCLLFPSVRSPFNSEVSTWKKITIIKIKKTAEEMLETCGEVSNFQRSLSYVVFAVYPDLL